MRTVLYIFCRSRGTLGRSREDTPAVPVNLDQRTNGPGRSVPKKGYIEPVSTKTHSGDPDGTGGFGSFLGFWRFLALKFRFYEKFHRPNWLEIVGKPQIVVKIFKFFEISFSLKLGFSGF